MKRYAGNSIGLELVVDKSALIGRWKLVGTPGRVELRLCRWAMMTGFYRPSHRKNREQKGQLKSIPNRFIFAEIPARVLSIKGG